MWTLSTWDSCLHHGKLPTSVMSSHLDWRRRWHHRDETSQFTPLWLALNLSFLCGLCLLFSVFTSISNYGIRDASCWPYQGIPVVHKLVRLRLVRWECDLQADCVDWFIHWLIDSFISWERGLWTAQVLSVLFFTAILEIPTAVFPA